MAFYFAGNGHVYQEISFLYVGASLAHIRIGHEIISRLFKSSFFPQVSNKKVFFRQRPFWEGEIEGRHDIPNFFLHDMWGMN